jgi:endonuclease I
MMQGACKIMALSMLLLVMTGAYAVVPDGYYDSAEGSSGAALKTCMFNIIKGHTVISYAELWQAFKKTDARADGKVWDIYSNITNYAFGTNQDAGSGGTTENQFYNREHSFPNSWFGGVKDSPMYTDLFHMYPADKWVNNQRGNMPFGNVSTVTGYSANHYCEWGNSTESGTSLTVFEPADELKGDLARSYFYMVTRYEDQVFSWTSFADTKMLAGNSYPAFSDWAKKVLLEWSRLDPVSAKETARNDSIYKLYQHNRNPYIDFSSLAEYVWGDSVSYTFHPSKYLSLQASVEPENQIVVWSEGSKVYIKTTPGERVEIYNLLGQKLFDCKAAGNQESCEVSGLKTIIVKVQGRRVKFCL